MDYRELINKILDKATDQQLRRLYHLILAFLDC